MSTTVGTTLASSKLVVTQDNLHLVGSSVDQLTVQFDQMAFDESLPADQINASKRHHSEACQTATRASTSSSSTGSALSSDDEPIRATARPLRTNRRREA